MEGKIISHINGQAEVEYVSSSGKVKKVLIKEAFLLPVNTIINWHKDKYGTVIDTVE